MPIQNFSQQYRCGSQADSCQIGHSDSGNAILKHAHLIIDKSLIKFKSQIYYSEDPFETTLLVLIKQFKTLTSVEAIIVAIRGEISLLNQKLFTIQKNLQQCIQQFNQARNYQRRVGELSPILRGTLSCFMIWLSVLILKECYLKGEVSITELGKMGAAIMVMSIYLLFHELIDFRVNKRYCELAALQQSKRQLTQQSQFLKDLEAKLDACRKNNQIGNASEGINSFSRPTSISKHLLNLTNNQIVSEQVANEQGEELHLIQLNSH